MGDILRTLPAVQMLRRRFPASTIGWALDAGWQILLREQPEIDELLPLPRKQMSGVAMLPTAARYLASVRRFKADLTLDFHGNLRSGLVTFASRASHRFGYEGHQQKEGNRLFTTHRVPSGDRRCPRMERNLDLVAPLGVDSTALTVSELALPSTGRDEAGRLIHQHLNDRPFALLSPGVSVSQSYKKPPATLLAEGVRRCDSAGLKTLVVWGPGEEGDAHEVARLAGSGAILAPATSLPVLAALTEKARLFISGDTGPMHLACALGTPVVAVYGPTDPQVNQPWGLRTIAAFDPKVSYSGVKRLDRERGAYSAIDMQQLQSSFIAAIEQQLEKD